MTLSDLREFRDEILDVAERHGASNVRVFGSVARGAAGLDSDVDLLVEISDDRSLFDQIALIQELNELLDHPVDVVSDRGLNPRIRGRVLKEAVAL
ncbi:MAG: nucleotidyltransferase family protein [bacterium]|nr:nucleotidyltransferase family protein [bacterium]